jgi:hypothetical protein
MIHDPEGLFLCLLIVAAVVAIIAEHFWGEK